MGILEQLGSMLSANPEPEQVNAAYDEVARSVPQSSIADGLTHAFNSDKTPPFEQMVGGLFGNSNPDQKAGILNQIMGSLGSGQATRMLESLGLGGLAAQAASGGITPQQAEQIPPEAVESLAQKAAHKDPSIVNMAANFYAQHPGLVQTIGASALALLMSRISSPRR